MVSIKSRIAAALLKQLMASEDVLVMLHTNSVFLTELSTVGKGTDEIRFATDMRTVEVKKDGWLMIHVEASLGTAEREHPQP